MMIESSEATRTAGWETVCSILRDQLSGPSFDTWIASLTLISFDDEVLQLSATSQFQKDWVLKNYKDQLSQACLMAKMAVTGCDSVIVPTLTIDVLSQQNASAESVQETAEAILSLDQVEHKPWTPRGAHSQLNPKYTFDSFVVSTHNRLCHAVAVAVSEAPASSYNPFFIYGPVGLGKTHLMQAIGHYVHRHHTHMNVRYLTAEQFTNDLIQALSGKTMNAFREKYRKIDLLLLDDVQFLEGKERTQEELFHTFNALHQSGKQIVLTSDRPPKSLSSLEERLRSRFEWGLIGDIQPPDLETRIAILQKKAEREGLSRQVPLNQEVLAHIAECFPNNIRELEGALNRLVAQALIDNGRMDLLTAQKILGQRSAQQTLTMEDIVQTVAAYFHLKNSDLKGPGRSKDLSHARQIAIYLIRQVLATSYPKIGEFMGGRNHASIMYATEKIREDIQSNSTLEAQVKELITHLKRV